ncbi:MAG: hypothetical protein JSS75_10270 [Bacteroidetes bacterium]|nr:hypothetical protein [Bacteroidota bacterium]
MNATEVTEFFAEAPRLRRPEELRRLLAALGDTEPTMLYDLTFHAAFASRLMAILKREGSAVQGFERMQQSLADSVQTIRTLLERAEGQFAIDLGLTAAQPTFGGLVEDLATLKHWMLERSANV